MRRLSRPDSAPPATPPRLAAAMSRPVSAGRTCSSRTQEDELQRHGHAAEQVRGPGAGHDLAQDRVPQDERQPFGDLGVQLLTLVRVRYLLAGADGEQGGHRDRVGDRVRGHGPGRADQADQDAAQTRPGQLRERLRGAELAVPLDQVGRADQDGQVALVGHVEEHGAHPGGDGDRVQLAQGERAERGGQRDRADDQHPGDVAPDHQPPLGPPVHDGAGREGDQRERESLRRGERADLEGGGAEHHYGGQRERQLGDGRARLADRLPAPQEQEVTMSPERPAWLVPRHGLHFARPVPGCPTGNRACENGLMAAMKVTTSAAMRARDVSRPHAEHLAGAEAAEADAVRGRPATPAAAAPAAAAPVAPAPVVPAPAVAAPDVSVPVVPVDAAGAEPASGERRASGTRRWRGSGRRRRSR